MAESGANEHDGTGAIMRASACGLLLLLAATGCTSLGGKSILDPVLPSALAPAESVQTAELPVSDAAKLHLSMAEQLDKQDKPVEAIAYYEKARELDPAASDKAARRLAVLYDQQDQQARALTEFQELLKKHPKDAAILNDLGYSYYNRGQWAIAEDHLRRATIADKKNKRAWVNLGLALAQQEKYPEAVTAFETAVTPAEAQANLGFVLVTQKKTEEAKAVYRKALQMEPELKDARKALDRLEGTAATVKANGM